MRELSKSLRWKPKKRLPLKKCAYFDKIWGKDNKEKRKVFILKYTGIFMDSGVKPLKQTVFIAKSTKKKQFLLTNSRVITSSLGASGLELHSSNTEPVTFFGVQSSLGERHNSRLGEHKQWFGGHGPGMPPRRARLVDKYCIASNLLRHYLK